MASDFGPTPGLRGCHFLDNVTDRGGWDASYLWAGTHFLPAADYLWWFAWRYTRPDSPVHCPEYMSLDALHQI